MHRFKVTIRGSGLWISLDDEVERVGFEVARIVDASTIEEAQDKALAFIAGDSKAQSLPGYEAPVLTVELVEPSSAELGQQPGFAFYPGPE